jgi:hypothetical protein
LRWIWIRYGTSNPVEHTEASEDGGTYDPWPPSAFEFFFANARIGLHLPVYSGLFTGQRLSDVIDMHRPVEGVAAGATQQRQRKRPQLGGG